MSGKRKLALTDLPNSESQVIKTTHVKMEDADLDIAVLKKESGDEEVNSPKVKKRRMSSPNKENMPSSGAKLLKQYIDDEEYRLKEAVGLKWENKEADASTIKFEEIEEGWKKTLKSENGSTVFGAEEEGSVPSIKEGIALLKETLSTEQSMLTYYLEIVDKH